MRTRQRKRRRDLAKRDYRKGLDFFFSGEHPRYSTKLWLQSWTGKAPQCFGYKGTPLDDASLLCSRYFKLLCVQTPSELSYWQTPRTVRQAEAYAETVPVTQGTVRPALRAAVKPSVHLAAKPDGDIHQSRNYSRTLSQFARTWSLFRNRKNPYSQATSMQSRSF